MADAILGPLSAVADGEISPNVALAPRHAPAVPSPGALSGSRASGAAQGYPAVTVHLGGVSVGGAGGLDRAEAATLEEVRAQIRAAFDQVRAQASSVPAGGVA